MDHLSWPWIVGMVLVPPVAAFPIARFMWKRKEVMLGSVAGAGVIFVAVFGLIFREYAFLEQLQQACNDAGHICLPSPSGFIRYAVYAFIGLFQLFWLFAAGLRYEERESEAGYSPEWRRK